MHLVNLSLNIDTTKPEGGASAEYAVVAEITDLGTAPEAGERRRGAQRVWLARIDAPGVGESTWEVRLHEYTPGTALLTNTFPTWERALESALSIAFVKLAELVGLNVADEAGEAGA